HLWMGDRHRAACRDLTAEDRDDTSVTAQDIPEANSHEPRSSNLIERGYHHLRDALGRAHQVGGIYGFVRGDQYKAGDVVYRGGAAHAPRPQNIIFDSFEHVRLHQRYVLISGGVKNRIHSVGADQFAHPNLILDVPDGHHQIQTRKILAQLKLDLVQLAFGPVEGHQPRGLEFARLPADFRSD